MKKIIFSTLLFISSSCTFITQSIDESNETTISNKGQNNLSILFSHNINAETHPCGCRHFPLGGLPQVAGIMKGVKDKNPLLYVDSGDTLFASSIIPETLRKSQIFKAKNLAVALDKMGLKYFLPGDQDFAAGWSFLNEIANTSKFQFLISNLKDSNKIKHQSWAKVEIGENQIYLLGLISPSILPSKYRKDFLPLDESLKAKLDLLKTKGWDPKSSNHRLIVLSHSGIDRDIELAKKYGEIDWIIGAHSQSFLRLPRVYNDVKITQVLSRNHYLGEITFDLINKKEKDSYQIHESRDELKDKLNPNPFLSFIDKHKESLDKIQQEEQSTIVSNDLSAKLQTSQSCLQCHKKQGEHWHKTSHSLAMVTLLNAKEANNLTCIKCHSVGLNQPQGFNKARDLVSFSDEIKEQSQSEQDKHYEKYMKDVKKSFSQVKSVRKLSLQERSKLSHKWIDLEIKHKVEHGFSNVQCLNCHTRHIEHPFEPDNYQQISKAEELAGMKNKCLECHDSDQSPEWYLKTPKGTPGAPNWDLINKHIKTISCPK